MKEIGITGNIGSGKTTVCKIFESLGVPVFYADEEAKKLYVQEDVKQQIRENIGIHVFNSEGNIEFKALAFHIFSNKEALNYINSLIHPLVLKNYENWKAEHTAANYILHESAILFEHNMERRFDKIIVIYCPDKIRIERVMQRDGVRRSDILKRISNQMEDDIKNSLADFVIVNDGTQMLIPQVMEIHKKLEMR